MTTDALSGEAQGEAASAAGTHAAATVTDDAASALPFVAPCRRLDTWAPFGWIVHAWADLRAAPRQSLTYGLVVVLLSWALAYVAIRFGGYFELLALVRASS